MPSVGSLRAVVNHGYVCMGFEIDKDRQIDRWLEIKNIKNTKIDN